jgi:murein DD-endopeptidase MepM/ murein hydrolase activator NlpD
MKIPTPFFSRTVFSLMLLMCACSVLAKPVQASSVFELPSAIDADQDQKSMFLPVKFIKVVDIKLPSPYSFPVKVKYFKGYSQQYFAGHEAYDIRAEYGSSITPIQAGVVKKVGYDAGGYGNYVIVEHSNGLQTLYAHLEKVTVEENQQITGQTEIGTVGLTGHTTGPHIHFEVHANGVRISPSLVLPEQKTLALSEK